MVTRMMLPRGSGRGDQPGRCSVRAWTTRAAALPVPVRVGVGVGGLGRPGTGGGIDQGLTGLDQDVPAQVDGLDPLGLGAAPWCTAARRRKASFCRPPESVTTPRACRSRRRARGRPVGGCIRRLPESPRVMPCSAHLATRRGVGQEHPPGDRPPPATPGWSARPFGVVGVLRPVDGGQRVAALGQVQLGHDGGGGVDDGVAHREQDVGHHVAHDDGALGQALVRQVAAPSFGRCQQQGRRAWSVRSG